MTMMHDHLPSTKTCLSSLGYDDEQNQKDVLLIEIIDQLRKHRNWCGEFHIQKVIYFLQELFDLKIGFTYILYKNSPYSFDLTDELNHLCSCYLIEFDHRSPGYGPSLVPTKTSYGLLSRFSKTTSCYKPQIEFITEKLGRKSTAELDHLSIALWVTRELDESSSYSQRAERIHSLKPYVSALDALEVLYELDKIVQDASILHMGSC